MAMSESYKCQSCGFAIEAWDDGNPYVSTKDGRRHYFYHPGGIEDVHPVLIEEAGRELSAAELEEIVKERVGIAADHLCPDCGSESKLDESRISRLSEALWNALPSPSVRGLNPAASILSLSSRY